MAENKNVTYTSDLQHVHELKCTSCCHSQTREATLRLVLRLRGGKMTSKPKHTNRGKIVDCGRHYKVVSELEAHIVGTTQTFTELSKCLKCGNVDEFSLTTQFVLGQNKLFDKDGNLAKSVTTDVYVIDTKYMDIKFVIDS